VSLPPPSGYDARAFPHPLRRHQREAVDALAAVWHPVPSVPGVRAELAQAFAAAWMTWIGGGPAIYTGNPEGAGGAGGAGAVPGHGPLGGHQRAAAQLELIGANGHGRTTPASRALTTA
jgi:hypothetical protein